jgi:hypothetical protein
MNLEDVCLLRSNELTRTIAGCAAIDPVNVLPLLDRLKSSALSDIQAHRYITALYGRYEEIIGADLDRQIEISLEVVKENHMEVDYMRWITSVSDVQQDAKNAIRELQALAITLDTIAGLRGWIATCQEISEWR